MELLFNGIHIESLAFLIYKANFLFSLTSTALPPFHFVPYNLKKRELSFHELPYGG